MIGGGPSVTADLQRLVALGVKPACVISANAHGSKQSVFPVDIGVNVDKIHNMLRVPMERHMRENLPNALIVNKHSWADYRLPDWRFNGNTGLTSIAVACVLGASQVIVTGIDFWHGGRVYFHVDERPPRRRSDEIRPAVVKRDRERMKPLVEFTRGANVRPMSGPLCTVYPTFDPTETLPPSPGVVYRHKAAKLTEVRMAATGTFMFSSNDVVKPGAEIAVSEKEHQINPQWRKKTRVLQS